MHLLNVDRGLKQREKDFFLVKCCQTAIMRGRKEILLLLAVAPYLLLQQQVLVPADGAVHPLSLLSLLLLLPYLISPSVTNVLFQTR